MVDVHNIRETMLYSLGVHIIYIYLAERQTILYIILIIFGGVIVSVLASSAVDRGFEHRWGQAKDYQISTCCSLLSQRLSN
jgi:hypothetical protein